MIKKVIQSCPEPCRREGRSDFGARSVLPVREHDKMATCLCRSASRRQGTPLVAFFNILIVHFRWSGLAVLSILLIAPLSMAQVVGKLGEMDRLEQQADDLAAQADPEGAALAIGKAAMMADLLTTESQKPAAGEIFQAASLHYRAQELGFSSLSAVRTNRRYTTCPCRCLPIPFPRTPKIG